jgi:hypothetical protein
MNYAALNQAIQDYCENTETSFVNNIPTFVKQAEYRIYRNVNLPANYTVATVTTTSSNKLLSAPADFLIQSELKITSGSDKIPLIIKDQSFIRQAYPDESSTGLPKYYGLFDNDSFILGPTPDAAYSVEVYYYKIPTSIVTAGTTWLGDYADEVLLYGSLVEAYTYMKGDQDMLALYQQRYNEALVALKLQAEGRMTIDEYRDGVIRTPRTPRA